ncbi:hypothetical protein [Demequina aurantiaca]|uniref:hypothetical protein n=1 Tax=Demequina aurantiaca TaxID=676200 RepID=UPI003D34DCA9
MQITGEVILQTIGWVGSLLIIWSLMQSRVLRFRWMNFAGAVVATAFNGIIGIWPFAFMNFVIAIIDAYWLRRIYRERHDAAVYTVLTLEPSDPFLQHFLGIHADDITRHQPDFDPLAPTDGSERSTFLVAHGDEAIGVVAVRHQGEGIGAVELDWVKPRFRDFAPGEFVYRTPGALTEAGFSLLELKNHDALDPIYLEKMGFIKGDANWVRELTP